MKIFNGIFLLLFVVSAVLQYNDPDPLLWIAIYLYAALQCLLALINKFNLAMVISGIVVYGIYAVYLFFTNDGVADWLGKHHAQSIAGSMQASNPWVENTREFFGLIIIISVLGINWIYYNKKGRNRS